VKGGVAERLYTPHMGQLEEAVDLLAAATGFSGVVRVDRGDQVRLAKAYGLAHRGYQIANTTDTRFAIASGGKGLTALTVVSLIEQGQLDLATTARSVLADDLPLIDDAVTVGQLLAHRSGIGDYLDEEADHAIADYVLPVPVHELAATGQYLRVLDGHPAKFAPDQRFSLQQRRLRRARADRRADQRHPFPRAGGAAGVRARRHAGHAVPAL
jgi:CubicO group peptidase (beta-lactamase class C family)